MDDLRSTPKTILLLNELPAFVRGRCEDAVAVCGVFENCSAVRLNSSSEAWPAWGWGRPFFGLSNWKREGCSLISSPVNSIVDEQLKFFER
jgi:hypothetical protein